MSNKRLMYDLIAAKEFARAFAGFYGYTIGKEVKVLHGESNGCGAYTIVTPDNGELEEFLNMVREKEVIRTR